DDGGPADGQQQRGDDYAGEDVGVDGQRQQLGTVDHGGDEDTDAHEQQESEQDRDARLASSGPDMTDAGEERRDRGEPDGGPGLAARGALLPSAGRPATGCAVVQPLRR